MNLVKRHISIVLLVLGFISLSSEIYSGSDLSIINVEGDAEALYDYFESDKSDADLDGEDDYDVHTPNSSLPYQNLKGTSTLPVITRAAYGSIAYFILYCCLRVHL